MAKILVAGLNPAWQQLFRLPSLRTDAVNRASEFHALASGKGMNAAKILAARGHDVTLVQIVAGENGRRMVDACARLGIRSLHVEAAGETRVCATLLHAGETTEVIAPFQITDPDLLRLLLSRIPDEPFEALLVCGTLPEGIAENAYEALAARVRAPMTIWDSVAGLSADALSGVTWLKVNAEEYRALRPLLATVGARPSLLITDGAEPASVRFEEDGETHSMRCALPRWETVVNPIGAGDTVTAMLAHGLLAGEAPRAAVSRALAAAAASCLTVLPAVWEESVAARIEPEIRWIEAVPS